MSDREPDEGNSDGGAATDESTTADEPAAEAVGAGEMDPETLKEAIVDLDVTIEDLAEAVAALDRVAGYTEPIEREMETLQAFSDRFEARWLAAEGVPPEDAGDEGVDAEPVTADDLLDAESAQEEALLEAVAALEVAQTELEQAIEEIQRRL